MCESPFTEQTTRLLNSKMSFTLYLYKVPKAMQLPDQNYEVAFKTERGVVSIDSRDTNWREAAHYYLCSIYGDEHDDLGDAIIWEL